MSINYLTSNLMILNEARDYLDGLMLGDGNIQCRSSKTGSYQQSCKEKSWLDKISEDLYEYGIESKVNDGRLQTGGFNTADDFVIYILQTRNYIELKEMHDRWYKPWYDIDNYSKHYWHKDKGGEYFIWQKVVPKDICLSSICLFNEYLGDGTMPKQRYTNSYQISLATDGFLREDTIFLSELLSETLDIKCSVTKTGKIGIYIQDDIITFLKYIENCGILNCYIYKFQKELMI